MITSLQGRLEDMVITSLQGRLEDLVITSLQGRLEDLGRPVVRAVPPVVPELVLALDQALLRSKRNGPEQSY